jgi:alkylated DNA repair protein (DNA oxidative demethylase)
MQPLFDTPPLPLAPNVWLLRGWVDTAPLQQDIDAVAAQAPFRHMQVPGGQNMSVAMTNCGSLGWVTDPSGYLYSATDPLSQQPWPALPTAWQTLVQSAADCVGWPGFVPDACLVNRYASGARMGLHQDKNERDYSQPIVSVSIGASCSFQVGGLRRSDTVKSIALHDGDVVVWGGDARLVYHGVRPLKSGLRYNLTFRKAG